MHDPLSIAIVGLGYWGKNFVRLINQDSRSILRAVADINADNLSSFSKSDGTLITLDYQEILSTSPDAVVIATPVNTHFQIASFFLGKGIPVLCEKPLTISLKETFQLKQLARKNRVPLMVGHTFEYNPVVIHIKQLLDTNTFGPLYYIDMVRRGLGPVRDDVNVVHDLATHDISIANYWLGRPPVSVLASGISIMKNGKEDIAFIHLQYDDGLIININVSWLDPIKQRKITISAEQKMAMYDDVSVVEKLRIIERGVNYQIIDGDFGSFAHAVRDGGILIPQIAYKEPLKDEWDHFIDCVIYRQHPQTDAENAANVIRVIEAINCSLQHRGQRIFL